MAARVNSRFIIIVLACVALAAAAVAGVWYIQVRGDAERLARQGDEEFARGEWRAAMTSYSRAARRDPANYEYLRKVEAAIMQQRPETTEEANDLYTRWMTVLRQEAQYRASVPEAHLRLITELHRSARLQEALTGSPPLHLWRDILLAAEQMLDRVPEHETERPYGLLYRGMAQLHLHATLTDQEVTRAEQDLADFNTQMPNHDLGWAALARGQMWLEGRARLGGDPRQIAERRARLGEVMQQGHAAVPEGPEMSTAYAAYLARLTGGEFGGGAVGASELNEALDVMADAIGRLGVDDLRSQWLVLEAVNAYQTALGQRGLPAAIRLVEQHLERDPEALVHRYTLANLQARSRHFEDAFAIIEDVLQSRPLPAGFQSRMQSNIRQAAASLATNVTFQQWTIEGGSESVDGTEHIERMRAARNRLERFVVGAQNDPWVLRADGKLALMEERYHDAAMKFERLIRDGVEDAEVLSGSAFSLLQTGEVGLAHERVAAVAETTGARAPAVMLLKAQIEFQMRRLEDASESIRLYLMANPDDESAVHLSRLIRAALDGERFNVDDPVQTALHHAQQLLGQGTQEGIEAAQVALLSALEMTPEHVGLLAMLASVQVQLGDDAAAQETLDRALAVAPGAPLLRQMEALVRTGDSVEAAIEFFSGIEDEVERMVRLVVSLNAIHERETREASEHQAAGRTEPAQRAAEVAERAAGEANRAQQRLRELAPEHVVLIEQEFNEAIRDRDWDRAARVVERAAAANADRSNGLLYEGRLALERRPPRPEQAVRAFQQAADLRPSSTAWRGLGMAYQQAGNHREGLRAYERSYHINPNDIHTVRLYLSLLLHTGDRTRAMRVARDASRVLPGDTPLRELWLDLEIEHNNLGRVLSRRTEIYNSNPTDRINAARLAVVLAESEPQYDLLFDDGGERLFTERQWNAMRLAEQRRVIEEARQQWRELAWQVIEEQEKQFGRDLDSIRLRAVALKATGDVAGGESVLRNFVEEVRQAEQESDTERSAPLTAALLALGRYLVETGQPLEAVTVFRAAAPYQDPTVREADLVLADLLFDRGDFARAKRLYEDVLTVSPNRTLEMRIVECDANLQRFDEAEVRLERLAASQADFMVEMLRATVARGRAEDHAQAGRPAEAERQWERFRAALSAAERLSPLNPLPHIQRARASMWEFRQSQRQSLLDDALSTLDRAEEVQPGDVQTSLARAEVHRLAGNNRSAIRELTRLLDRFPDQGQARRTLMDLHVEAGNVTAAIEVVQQAIDRNPSVAVWHEAMGHLQVVRRPPDYTAAAAAYRRAYELTGSLVILHRELATYIRRAAPSSPDYRTVLHVLQNERDAIERDPSIEVVLAHALIGSGRADEGRQRLDRSYRRMRASIAAGSREPNEIGLWYQTAAPLFATMPMGDFQRLLDDLTESTEHGAPDAYETVWMSRAYAERGAVGMNRAVELLRTAASAAEAHADPAFRTVVLFELSGRQIMMEEYTAAAETLRDVLQMLPDHWVALNNLAFLEIAHLGDASSGLTRALRALELQPGNPSVLDTIGWAYFHLGQFDRAEQYLRDSLRAQETAATQLHLAHVMSATGRYEAAQSRLRRAAELNPDPKIQADIDRLGDDIRTRRAVAQ